MGCLSLNSSHRRSISSSFRVRQPVRRSSRSILSLFAVLALVGLLAPELVKAGCARTLGSPAFTAGPLAVPGTTPDSTRLALRPGHEYLLEIEERGNDAGVEILGTNGQVMARVDQPERRTGTRRAVVTAPASGIVAVRVTGKEHAGAKGAVWVRAFDLAGAQSPACLAIFRRLAAADASYAAGLDISSGRIASAGQSARDAFQQAAESYAAAERALSAVGDRQLRGEAELALAALSYLDLQDWEKAAEWAKAAAAALGPIDPYRQARAESLLAGAWIEMGSAGPVGHSARLLDEARALLRRLSRFHLRRGERYDAALQLTNVGLTYLYQGRYPECVSSSATARRLFASLHERVRSAQARQNEALCLWGLGRLTEARDDFKRSLADIGPEPYPHIYLASVTNTALLDYSLGDYDESLRLYDRALSFAERTQAERNVAYCLYGIGLNYRALGDLTRAREFLERSLRIRTLAVDARGRMNTLRALAGVYAEEGRLKQAVGLDREALALAVNPLAFEGITVELATHTAAAGHLEAANGLLDAVLEKGPRGDPLILADALVRRALILRGLGRSDEALGDLRRALWRFRALKSIHGEFATDLELARTLRLSGKPAEALAMVGRALALGDEVRLQSVNPDFRVQLEAPLRSAYDLKIELLRGEFDAAVAAGRTHQAAALAASAFAAADAARARSFADAAAEKYSPALRRELAPELIRREDIYRQLASRRFALDSLPDISPASNPRARHLLSDIAELERQADAVNTLIATRASRHGDREPGGRRASVPSLPAGMALVSFWLGSQSSYAWVDLPGELHWVRLASPATIAQRSIAFHASLTRFVDRPLEQRLTDAERLSDLVIRPLEPWLSGVRQWVIVPDGALDYVPFVALEESRNPTSFVVLHHDVALTPAAWMLDTHQARRQSSYQRAMLLVADPVYQPDDPRLAPDNAPGSHRPAQHVPADDAGYRRLAFAAPEAAAIRREFPPAAVDELIGLSATRARFLSLDLSRYRFIHIAAHGTVDTRVPELSALMLGTYDARGEFVDGAVRVSDLELETLRAQVVVFSACNTAMGKQVPSEGLVGIGSTALARGARAVVASLWPVSDEMSAELMTEFYRHLLRDSMSAPTALAAAMRSVVSRAGVTDPALWAAYQVSVATLGPDRPQLEAESRVLTIATQRGTP